MYATLNDAKHIDPIFEEGTTKIWYLITLHSLHEIEKVDKVLFHGEEMMEADSSVFDVDALKEHYALLGSINKSINSERDAGEVFHKLQGEYWSPAGEANQLILGIGTHHTSMSMGDVIETEDAYYVTAAFGFTKINK